MKYYCIKLIFNRDSMHWEIFLFFLIIAFVYSSVGFGGGSSYLAVLAMYNLPYQEIRLTALICNIIVVIGGVYIYIKNKQIGWKKVIPITLVSVPMAYLGAILKISQETFFLVLGITLVIAALLLWIKTETANEDYSVKDSGPSSLFRNSFLGGGIGFLSGLVGIGGGIFSFSFAQFAEVGYSTEGCSNFQCFYSRQFNIRNCRAIIKVVCRYRLFQDFKLMSGCFHRRADWLQNVPEMESCDYQENDCCPGSGGRN